MKNINICISLLALLVLTAFAAPRHIHTSGWVNLFDGKSLSGWKASEHPNTFSIEDGMIVVHGDRAHLFYVGPVMNHDFKNFEFKAKVMTTPGSNSGIFFHTTYQEEGWPSQGYEAQVNATHTDWRKTASLYASKDIKELSHKDNEWFTYHIIVNNKQITIKINDAIINEFTDPENGKLSHGTFALQGHDPNSKVFYKEIMVKSLAD